MAFDTIHFRWVLFDIHNVLSDRILFKTIFSIRRVMLSIIILIILIFIRH